MLFNSSTVNLLLSAIISAMLGMGYVYWKNSVEQGATDRLRVLQLEEQVRVQNKLIEDMKVINKRGDELITDMKQKEADLNNKLKGLDVYLDNQPKDQKQSSEILKRTMKELSQ